MKAKFSFIVLFLLFTFQVSVAQNQDEKKKPKQKIEILIDGKQFILEDGETFNYENKSIRVKSYDFLTFDSEKIHFDYPQNFSFEYEEEPLSKIWSFDGNSFVILYFEMAIAVGLDILINEMVNKFGKKNCKVVDYEMELANKKYFGKRLYITLIGQKLTYDMILIANEKNATTFFAFQDSKNEDGTDSLEGLETLKIISKTMKIK